MPPEAIKKHRVQRQFTTSSARLCFPAERLVTPPPSSGKIQFAMVKPDSAAQATVVARVMPEETETRIPKPDGQVGRPGRGGYTLSDKLETYGWSLETYEKFLVAQTDGLCDLKLTGMLLVRTISATWRRNILTWTRPSLNKPQRLWTWYMRRYVRGQNKCIPALMSLRSGNEALPNARAV